MKRMNFIRLCTMVLALGALMTSCNDDEDSMVTVIYDFTRVNHDFPITFTNASGQQIVPKQPIIDTDLDNDMAMISYQYDRRETNGSSNMLPVNLLENPFYFETLTLQSDISVTPNAPIATLTPTTYYGVTLGGGFFDDHTLILPIGYKIKRCNSETEQAEELQAHSFVLTYNSDATITGGTITLYLHHIVDDTTEDVTRDYDVFAPQAFDLSPILQSLSSISSVTVSIQQNNQDDLESAYTNTYNYTYPF